MTLTEKETIEFPEYSIFLRGGAQGVLQKKQIVVVTNIYSLHY
jgi:hypothetical protein